MTKTGRIGISLVGLLILGGSGIAFASQGGDGNQSVNVAAEGDGATPGATATPNATTETATTETTVDKRDEKEIQRVVEQAENLYMAMVYPPPANGRDGSFANDRSAAPEGHLNADRTAAHISDADKSAMKSNADAQIPKVFTAQFGAKMRELVDHAISMQEGGNFVGGGGGADVVSFDKLTVSGDTAIVEATVHHWAKTGQLNPETHQISWTEPDTQLNVHLGLVKTDDGWRIDSRTWEFVGGGGP